MKHNDHTPQETNYEEYLRRQMEDPEFRAHYALAQEKARLEILVCRLREDIKEERERKVILRDLSTLSRRIADIRC